MLPAFAHSRLAVNSVVSASPIRSRMLPSSPRRHGGRALLAALLASALTGARAQDGSGQDQQVNTAMVALLAAVVAVFVFIAASTVYLRHCSGYAASRPPPPGDATVVAGSLDSFFASRSWWHRQRRRGRGGRGSGGLDTEVVEAFPTMTYAEAKALRVGKTKGGEALECVVCLSEFEDGERLRLLLPKCSHVFHPDCIAEWLAGHVTCPVCRCNLETASDDKDTTSATGDGQGQPPPPTISFASSISSETAAALQGAAAPLPVAVVIDVATEEDEEERRQEALELQRIGSQRRAVSGRRPAVELARWHSTVRSQSHPLAARLERDLERFTLRLPEHVRTEIVAAAAAKHSSRLRRGRRRRAGQGGGAGARSEPLVGRLGSRWQSLLGGTTFSGRLSFFSASRVTGGSGGGGEVSSSSSYSYAKLRGKRVAAIDVAADDVPAEGSVRLDSIGVVGGSGADGAKASSVKSLEAVAAAAADEEKGVEKQRRT